MIGHRCSIYTATHDIDDPNFSGVIKTVEIGDYAVVFPHSLIMPEVKIGRGAVVMPGSIVTKDVGDFHVVGGVPAKFVRERSQVLAYKLDYQYLFTSCLVFNGHIITPYFDCICQFLLALAQS